MLGLKLNHVSKRGPRHQAISWTNVDEDLLRPMSSLGQNELRIQIYIHITNHILWFMMLIFMMLSISLSHTLPTLYCSGKFHNNVITALVLTQCLRFRYTKCQVPLTEKVARLVSDLVRMMITIRHPPSGSLLKICNQTGHLIYCGGDNLDTISQTTVSNPFSWMKMYEFLLKVHWFWLMVQLKIFQHRFR